MNNVFRKSFEKSAAFDLPDAVSVGRIGTSVGMILGLGALGGTVITNPREKKNQREQIKKFVREGNKNSGAKVQAHFIEDMPLSKHKFKSKALEKATEPDALGAYQTSRDVLDFMIDGEKKIVKEYSIFDRKIEKLEKERDNKSTSFLRKMQLNQEISNATMDAMRAADVAMTKLELKAKKKIKESKALDDIIMVSEKSPTNIVSHEYGHALRGKDKTPQEQIDDRISSLIMTSAGLAGVPAAHLLTKNKKIRGLSALLPLLGAFPLLREEGGATIDGAIERGRQESFWKGLKEGIKNSLPFATYAAAPAGMTAAPFILRKLKKYV